AKAYWKEYCAKEYSAASMVAESETVRLVDGKVVDAKRISGGPREPSRAAPTPDPDENYSDEQVAEVLAMTPEKLKERLKEEGYPDEAIADLLLEQKKLRKEYA